MEIGSVLKEARESKNISLETVEQETKIRKKYLDALENENYDLLPGRVYVKGFLRNYANFLGLNPYPLLAAYDEQNPAPQAEDVRGERDFTSLDRPRGGRFVVLGIIALGLVFFIAYYPFGKGLNNSLVTPNAPTQTDNPAPSGNTKATQNSPTAVQGQGVRIVLNVTEQTSWVNVEVDGVQTFSGVLSAGQSKEFAGSKKINLRLGNPGVVQVEYNGNPMGILGQNGQPVSKVFNAPRG